MASLSEKVETLMKAGRVRRCHTFHHQGHYSVAEHTYGVLAILFVANGGKIYPPLFQAALLHDEAEYQIGDLPKTAKRGELGKAVEKAERRARTRDGFIYPNLTAQEELELEAADVLELYLWSRHQWQMGNATAPIHKIEDATRGFFKAHAPAGKLPLAYYEIAGMADLKA